MHAATTRRNSIANKAVMSTLRTEKCGARSTAAMESPGKGLERNRKHLMEKARARPFSSKASMTQSPDESHPLYFAFIDQLILEDFDDSKEIFGDFGDYESGDEQDCDEFDSETCHTSTTLQEGDELASHGTLESQPTTRLLARGFSWGSAKMVRMPSERFDHALEADDDEHDVTTNNKPTGPCSVFSSCSDDIDAALPIGERVETRIAIKTALERPETSTRPQQDSANGRTKSKKSRSSRRSGQGSDRDSVSQRSKERHGRRGKDSKGSSRRRRGISRTTSTRTRETIDDTHSNASAWESVATI